MTHEEFKQEARRLRPQLLLVAQRYLGSDDAEDVVQDALLRLWQMVDELRLPMDALARVLTRNLCISCLRKQKRTPSVPLSAPALSASAPLPPSASAPPTVPGGSPAEDSASDQAARIDRMMAVVEALPPLQQTILRLRHMEGMAMSDIAALIGTSEVALRKALSRARQSVRQQYMKRYEQ